MRSDDGMQRGPVIFASIAGSSYPVEVTATAEPGGRVGLVSAQGKGVILMPALEAYWLGKRLIEVAEQVLRPSLRIAK